MTIYNNFEEFESSDSTKFKRKGFLIKKCENRKALDMLKKEILELLYKVDIKFKKMNGNLNYLHKFLNQEEVNEIRMNIYSELNSYEWFRPTYFSFARKTLEEIVGRELVIQNRINFNIMMPFDDGSNIHPHIDPHSGESPFQCVLWIPLTNAFGNKSICLLPPEENDKALKHFDRWMKLGGRKRIYEEVKDKLIWANVPYGSFILFSPTLLHGSVMNDTNETRLSFNTRFKSLFSPYVSQEKGLGTFYLPIRTSAATHFGLRYNPPKGLNNL